MNAQVLMIASGKGGTGKSTISVLLGAHLAALGRRVLLVELDSGLRSVDLISGVYGKTVYDVEDILSGRCTPEKAVVESPVYRGLFVVSAPYSGGHVVPSTLARFIDTVCSAFDFVLLDTAAGMGAPFEAARQIASLALLVITPDPVTVRDGRIVSDALADKPNLPVRLLLNKVPRTLADTGIEDLDACIDTVGAQLIGVVPHSPEIMRCAANGTALNEDCLAHRTLAAIANRLCGKEVPLVLQ